MSPKSMLMLQGLNDTVLGSIGASIPQSEGLDHAVRYFGTWSGSDKLMMTVEYTAKLVAPALHLRALLQYSNDLRDAPYSLTARGLSKLATTLSSARRVSGLWGILPIIKWLSAIERSNPTSRAQLTIERIQALSMLAFYILETVSFFASPAAPLIPRSVLSERGAARASLWSVRAWGLYTVLQIAHLRNDWKELKKKQRVLEKSAAGEATSEEAFALQKKKKSIVTETIVNLAFLPCTVHWSIVGGIFKTELPTVALSLIAAVASFQGGWEASRLPAPTR